MTVATMEAESCLVEREIAEMDLLCRGRTPAPEFRNHAPKTACGQLPQ